MSSNNENLQNISVRSERSIDIQYGLFVVGILILIFQLFTIYKEYCNTCMSKQQQHQPPKNNMNTGVNFSPQLIDRPSPTEYLAPKKQRNGQFNEHDLEGFISKNSDDQAIYDPISMSLEKSVFDSHNSFVDDAYSSMTPSSAASVRDDRNDVNPRVGLRRVDYSGIILDGSARTISTETPDQMESENQSTYTL